MPPDTRKTTVVPVKDVWVTVRFSAGFTAHDEDVMVLPLRSGAQSTVYSNTSVTVFSIGGVKNMLIIWKSYIL